MNSCEIEIAVATQFNPRMNLIVPNVSWGLNFNYELDLIIVTQNQYAWEVEIKISLSDLRAEKRKHFLAHTSDKIKRLYFAVPYYLEDKAMALIPKRAGLLSINEKLVASLVKAPEINTNARKLKEDEISKLGKLAAMRIWSLKEKLLKLKKKEILKKEKK